MYKRQQFGIGLPRTSAAQSQYGMKIPVSEAAPGDLIFYAKNGQVYHVVIYIGNGRTVEAASTRSGICSHGVNYANAVWATRLLDVYKRQPHTREVRGSSPLASIFCCKNISNQVLFGMTDRIEMPHRIMY